MDYDRYDRVRAVQWQGDRLRLLDQRLLPREERWIDCRTAAEVTQAIRDLVVRGAPAIGIAAAWGVVLAAQQGEALDAALAMLRAARIRPRGDPSIGAGLRSPASLPRRSRPCTSRRRTERPPRRFRDDISPGVARACVAARNTAVRSRNCQSSGHDAGLRCASAGPTKVERDMSDIALPFFVVTGGPGSGKTTLIEALARAGFTVAPEAGRGVICEQQAHGGRALPSVDPLAFAAAMLARDLASYDAHRDAAGPVFFDRGEPHL